MTLILMTGSVFCLAANSDDAAGCSDEGDLSQMPIEDSLDMLENTVSFFVLTKVQFYQ